MRRTLSLLLCLTFLASCTTPASPSSSTTGSGAQASDTTAHNGTVRAADYSAFGASVKYEAPSVSLNPAIAEDFSTDEIKTLETFEKTYDLTLTPAQKKFLSTNKFVMLEQGAIKPQGTADIDHEFYALYDRVNGERDYKVRSQANAVYYSSDVFMFAFARLYEETLKEIENRVFFPAMKTLSQKFFEESDKKAAAATGTEKEKWIKIRNYFAVPYALLSTSVQPLTKNDYMKNGEILDAAAVKAAHDAQDKTADAAEKALAFVSKLTIDQASKDLITADLQQVYKAADKGVPQMFLSEYKKYGEETQIEFAVDFTQFTPRSHYTSSSLRRQYFRAMNWYIQLPFFLKSPELTEYAFGITQLMAENQQQLNDYNKLEAAINFMVGTSDDLMPADYMGALNAAKGQADQEKAVMQYLINARQPRIKSLPAFYQTIGKVQSGDVTALTKGMRFFSGKFIIDSYWTDMLTQGDEAPLPGFTQKLPPMASSLEVMSLLGSDYAQSQIPTLDFYKPENKEAIDQMMKQLQTENAALDASYWQSNIYNTWLWTIRGLFDWQKENVAKLPAFMRSPMWNIKTLMTGAGFWTQARHATLLYAKQSFAEKGGGGGACDPRLIPDPAKSYIEPQPEVYARLHYMAERLNMGLQEQGFVTDNQEKLSAFATFMNQVQEYTLKQLGNQLLTEKIKKEQVPDEDQPSGTCVSYSIENSDWEKLRIELTEGLYSVMPVPAEGPIMSAKDKRAAIVADVHTGGDSSYDARILYEGIGIPVPMIVAVKDANGARFVIGFAYSQYESTVLYGGQRMTDEDWQKKFYKGEDIYTPYDYTAPKTWPAFNTWYQAIMQPK